LLKNLDYRAPVVLTDALGSVLPAADGSLDVLDAGCGTGLCAPLLRPRARTLVGVDLSGGMIEKARARGGYDELVVAELTAYLQTHPAAYDVVISADTLIYFGDLAPVLKAAHGALRPGGWLAFTLEVLEGEGDRYELSSSGRYQHTRDHTQAIVEAAGFDRITIGMDMLRKEHGKIVSGWVVLARRGGNDMR
jgi:predicted TPR repeat methyltransferase